jgi:RHS repeat-associated protein
MERNGVTYRIVSDHLGSVRLVVDTTTGAVVQRVDYDEWGSVAENTGLGFQPFGFAGGLVDELTGVVRFGVRDYDPTTGRWSAKDPTAFLGGDANLYRYASGDPMNAVDPTGTASCHRVRDCFQANRFSSLFQDTPLHGAAEFLEIAPPVSLAGDLIATVAKASRTGVGGGGQPYASGLNFIFRRFADLVGSSALKGALVDIGDALTPPLALLGAFTAGYNASILAQCALGVLD